MKSIYPIFPVDAARRFESSILGDDSDKISRAMHNAGTAIGEAIHADYRELRDWPAEAQVLLLAGKGLNAGDAFVAADMLAQRIEGVRVTVVETVPEAELNPIAAAALKQLSNRLGDKLKRVDIAAFLDAEEEPVDVVMDGLYGLGFNPPLREEPAALLKRVNERDDILLRAAIDVPSGVGESADAGSFVADFTYVPGVAKAPCFDGPNQPFVGRIRFLEIDPFRAQPVPEDQRLFVASRRAHLSLNRVRAAHSDKRSFGHCLILAGSVQMPGAAVMASRSALQAGAGLVTTLAPANVSTHLASSVPEAMWRPLSLNADGGIDVEVVRHVSQLSAKAQAILIGPGLVLDRSSVYAISRIIRETPLAVVLDASALIQDIITAVLGRSRSSGPVVVTPHRGEYARMLGMKEDPQDNDALISFSQRYRVVTVLKGSPTLVCDGHRIIHAAVGGPILARGGSGDILSGMLLALLAQDPSDPFGAALKAVTWHGAAADSLARERGSIAVRTTELLGHFAPSLRA